MSLHIWLHIWTDKPAAREHHGGMKLVLAIGAALLGALLLINAAQAQRTYHQGELDAMLAPIALQPDSVVAQVLIAATHPEDVAAAARWSRANPHLRGDDAVRAVYYERWDASVKALVAVPELLIRMDESPQWLHDLGEAFRWQQPHVMETVQQLRRRAQAAGHLANSDEQVVYHSAEAIYVQPRTEVVYVRYYDPYVVYGPWWWPHYRPVYWRPWAPRPVYVRHFAHSPLMVHKPAHRHVVVKPHVRVPEAQRRPIIQSAPLFDKPMPAASGFSQHRGAGLRKERR